MLFFPIFMFRHLPKFVLCSLISGRFRLLLPPFPQLFHLSCSLISRKLRFIAPSLPGNSVFDLHHVRDSSVSYVLACPENSGLYFLHFGDFFSLFSCIISPANSVFYLHHFRD